MTDTLHIHLRDCTVPLTVGIYDYERTGPQPVIISVEVAMKLDRRYDHLASADMASVVDYEPLQKFLTQTLPTLGHIPLLESLAEHIVSFCFKDPRAINARVRIDKPDAFHGHGIAGVEIRRSRP